MKKILLFLMLVMNLLAAGIHILGTDPQGEEIPMKVEKIGKNNMIRVTIPDGVESLTTEYVETRTSSMIKQQGHLLRM